MTKATRSALGDIRLSPKMLASIARNYVLLVRLLKNLRSDKYVSGIDAYFEHVRKSEGRSRRRWADRPYGMKGFGVAKL